MKLYIPNEVNFIINELYKNGFEAYMVGGCVRDALINKTPNDYDITTNALPENIISIFKKTIPTGIKHGTITVLINNKPFEVTTYRVDGEYLNNRKPKEVLFVSNIKEDLARRDFTINAMAYNSQSGLIDYFNGQNDLNNSIISCVGNPTERFTEDALRMLRAIRFSSQLGFQINTDTLESITQNSTLLKNISKERINTELNKILTSTNPSYGLSILNKTNLLLHVFSIQDKVYNFKLLDKAPNKLHIRLALLLIILNLEKCNYESILKSLKYDNKTIDYVLSLLGNLDYNISVDSTKPIKTLLNKLSISLTYDLLDLKLLLNLITYDDKTILTTNINNIILLNEPIHMKDLDINGSILIEQLNITNGKEVGIILNYLLDKVMDNPILNTKNELLRLANKFQKK